MIYRKLQIKYGVNLSTSTKIGHGFKIEHLNGIVVNPDVVIGRVQIWQRCLNCTGSVCEL